MLYPVADASISVSLYDRREIVRQAGKPADWIIRLLLFCTDAGWVVQLKDYVARTVCGRDRPFAGIQLVISGDFCQLPPVPGRGKLSSTQFAFESVAWKQCIARPVVLTKVFRQQDQHFVDMLNALRTPTE
ncbi:hypothetical protein OE88DRAFT_159787 [Heliocybe sulcata]|uniref:ATP-dependent DNA helicase n=1 Tax=Heliocybe sulcata TaxID=5364 RepID=A0A5C3NKB0_9AGAM|nr:hypothetical protein OE88DRAFT_159787 [Heliocybe sulcata]